MRVQSMAIMVTTMLGNAFPMADQRQDMSHGGDQDRKWVLQKRLTEFETSSLLSRKQDGGHDPYLDRHEIENKQSDISQDEESDNRILSDGYYRCVGFRACYQATGSGNFILGNNTCLGDFACIAAAQGRQSSSRSGRENSRRLRRGDARFEAGDGVCIGHAACEFAAYRPGGWFNASDASCVGGRACSRAGFYGSFRAGKRSCVGDEACCRSGYGPDSSFEAGDGSCAGYRSCYRAGVYGQALASIGSASCNGNYSCISSNGGSFSVGDNSCNCDGCCQNLKAGSRIGDFQCNALSDLCYNQTDPVIRPEFPSSVPSMSSIPSIAPSHSIQPSNSPSEFPSLAPSVYLSPFQNLTLNPSTNLLGLTASDIEISLAHLVNNDENELQELKFDNTTKQLRLTNSTTIVDLSHLSQELTFDESSNRLRLTHSKIGVDLSSLALQDNQNLTFNESTHILGLSNSAIQIDLGALVRDKEEDALGLVFDYKSNRLGLNNSATMIDLSHLDRPPQELTFDNDTMRLGLTDSDYIDLSPLSQDLAFDMETMKLELTDSGSSGVDLSALAQDLTLNNDTMMLGLTASNSKVDLSPLAQDLKFHKDTKQLELTGGEAADLSPLAQDLSLNRNNKLEISAGGNGADLSPLRIVALPASIGKINGGETKEDDNRRLKGKKDDKDKFDILYGGEDTGGFTILSDGRLVGMTITAKHRLATGVLRVGIADCSNLDSVRPIVSPNDAVALTLVAGPKRSNVVKFNPPIEVDGGVTLCFEPIRVETIKSEDKEKENAASLVLMLEQ